MGYTNEDLAKPIIGIANTWTETMPCNLNLRRLAGYIKQGVRAAGGTPMEFNTIAISDGITMGTEGMKSSLVSREIIADSIELVGRGHMFDAVDRPRRLRQDDARRGDGDRPPRRAEHGRLRRHNHAGQVPGPGCHRSSTSSR